MLRESSLEKFDKLKKSFGPIIATKIAYTKYGDSIVDLKITFDEWLRILPFLSDNVCDLRKIALSQLDKSKRPLKDWVVMYFSFYAIDKDAANLAERKIISKMSPEGWFKIYGLLLISWTLSLD